MVSPELIEQVNPHLMLFQEQLPDLDSARLPEAVYHYTDVAGLIGILSTKCLWATDYRYLNDSSELAYATEVAREVVRRDFSGQQKGLADSFITHISDAPLPVDYERTSYYLTCFSELDNSLSQWRAYGGNQGFALQFPGDISTILNYATEGRQNIGITLVKVIYDRAFHEEYVSRLIRQLIELCESELMQKAAERFTDAELMETFLPFYWGQINRASTRFKHPDFESEREWRMVQWGDHHRENYRTGITIVPYIMVGFGSESVTGAPLPLTGVRHGPSTLPEQTLHALDRILLSAGYQPEVCKRSGSDTPARL